MYEELKAFNIDKISIRGFDKEYKPEIVKRIFKHLEEIDKVIEIKRLPGVNRLDIENNKTKNSPIYFSHNRLGDVSTIFVRVEIDYDSAMDKLDNLRIDSLYGYHLINRITAHYFNCPVNLVHLSEPSMISVNRSKIMEGTNLKEFINLMKSTEKYKERTDYLERRGKINILENKDFSDMFSDYIYTSTHEGGGYIKYSVKELKAFGKILKQITAEIIEKDSL